MPRRSLTQLTSMPEIAAALTDVIPSTICLPDIVFVCIGTDRSTGDALGPLVGTYLRAAGYDNVYGTIDDPVHAENLAEIVASLPAGKTVIGIDACLGRAASVGTIAVREGPIEPGAGVGKSLPAVGDYAITGTVNVSGLMEYAVLQCTRLSVVMRMARAITEAVGARFPIVTKIDGGVAV